MKLAILQCDSVREQFRAQFNNYPAMIKTIFNQVDSSIELNVYDVQHGQYPSRLEDYDGYVTTGSKASVYDHAQWIDRLERFIIKLHQAQHKLIAICFGHQLVAQVFGGKTEKSEKGWGVGVYSSDVISQKEWMQPCLNKVNVIVSHQDQVTVLPPEAELIASNDFCPNFMFQLGNNILTIQGHPEFTKDYAKTLMQYRENIIGYETYQTGLQSLQLKTHELELTSWFIEFINNY